MMYVEDNQVAEYRANRIPYPVARRGQMRRLFSSLDVEPA